MPTDNRNVHLERSYATCLTYRSLTRLIEAYSYAQAFHGDEAFLVTNP